MKLRNNKIKDARTDKFFYAITYVLLAVFFIIELYPMLFVVSASISDPQAVSTGKMILWPVGINFDGYRQTFAYNEIWTGYANTIFYTVVGTLLNLLFTIPAAYALSRKDLKGRGLVMTLFIITMYFGGGLIPNYINMYEFGLLNTRGAMLVPGLVTAYNLIVARTFFGSSIPHELQEAAYLDGCSTFKLFGKIVLPLSAPIICVMALYYGVGHWNAYFNAFLYLAQSRDLFPLQVILKEILTQSKLAADALMEGGYSAEEIAQLEAMGETADRMKYCIIVVAAAPMLAVYPWLQKFFNKGVMIGSVKG